MAKLKIKNPTVLVLSIIALGFVFLAFYISWWFLIGAIILMMYNQRALMRSEKKQKKLKKNSK